MSSNNLVCTQCGYVGKPKRAIKGNGFIEVILWLCFLIPGLIYSIWRSSSRYKVCPKCGNTALIPLDSPRAKTIMSENMTSEVVAKIESEQDNTVAQSTWLDWCKAHPILTVLIVLLVIPFVIGTIANIFGSDEVSPVSKATSPETQEVLPALTLTERLTKTVNDPYWTDTTPADYSTNIALQVQSVVFSTYANDVIEGEKSTSTEDNRLALELRKKLVAKQVSEYPKIRQAYAEIARKTLWQEDIDVTLSGPNDTTLTLVGAIFASNKGIAAVHVNLEKVVEELRFKRVNYKWIEHEEGYQYFDVNSVSDSELRPVAI
jgi:hypothetical protein